MFPTAEELAGAIVAQGINGEPLYPEPGAEPFDLAMLAGTAYRDLSQYFGKDHDFLITGLCGTQTGSYSVQFILPNGRQLSTAQIANANIIGTAQFPTPIWPAIRVPAGGRLGLNLTETSGAGNTVQILFMGVRLYRTK